MRARSGEPIPEGWALDVQGEGTTEAAAALDGASPWQMFWRVVFPTMRPINIVILVETVIELFGTGRCFFGSNWPVDSLYRGSFADLVDVYRRIIAPYSRDEQEALLNGNASRFYRF